MPDDVLTDLAEILLRQIHPSWVQDGRVTGQAFRPSAKDAGLLSVSRSSVTSPAEAWRGYTQELELKSDGVWGVSVGECSEEDLPARAAPEPGPEPPKDDAHAVIDFSGVISKSQCEARGTRLARKASLRGRLAP